MARRQFIAVSASSSNSAAIDADGGLWMWGANVVKAYTGKDADIVKTPVQIMAGTKFVSVSAGPNHYLAIDAGGGLRAGGSNQFGALGGTPGGFVYPPRAAALADGAAAPVKAARAGYGHSVIIDAGGFVFTWGGGEGGALGDGTASGVKTAPGYVNIGGKTFEHIAAGDRATFAVASDNTIYGWGFNGGGQIGDGTAVNVTRPKEIRVVPPGGP
jgi:alpha-tubulin suppressor-like RCC1 family protein